MALRLLLAVVTGLAVACASCGDDNSESADTTEEGGAPEASDGRRQGGQLTIASAPFESLDPRIAFDLHLYAMLWRGLYSLGADNQLTAERNGVAAGLPEVSEDGLVVTVRLKEGLKWSDGDDLRAEDFVAGVVRSCNPLASEDVVGFSNVVGCEDMFFADPDAADLSSLQAAIGVRAVDVLTIEFTLRQAQPTFPASALTTSFSTPVPVHLPRFATATPENPGEWGASPADLVYNGPYVLVSVDDVAASFEPNPEWAGATEPRVDRLNVRFYDGVPGALDAYRAGDVDVVQLSNLAGPEEIEAARREFSADYGQHTAPATRALHMNLTSPVLSNLDVRLALARAIDRELLNEVVYGATNIATTSWIPPPVSGVAEGSYDDAIGFDPEAARRHLEAAGYANGEGFPVLSFLIGPSPETVAVAEFLGRQFKEVLNIETDVEEVDGPTLFQRLPSGQFDMYLFGWVGAYGDPEEWLLGLFNTGGSTNWDSCSDPEIDALIKQAEFDTDDQRRRESYLEAERLVIERVCGVAPFAHLAFRYLLKPSLTGFVESISTQDYLYPGDGTPEAWGFRAE
jgi:oligopeptide transport system substrate-binding protein